MRPADEKYAQIPSNPTGHFMNLPGVYCQGCAATYALYWYSVHKPDGLDDNGKPYYNSCFQCDSSQPLTVTKQPLEYLDELAAERSGGRSIVMRINIAESTDEIPQEPICVSCVIYRSCILRQGIYLTTLAVAHQALLGHKPNTKYVDFHVDCCYYVSKDSL